MPLAVLSAGPWGHRLVQDAADPIVTGALPRSILSSSMTRLAAAGFRLLSGSFVDRGPVHGEGWLELCNSVRAVKFRSVL